MSKLRECDCKLKCDTRPTKKCIPLTASDLIYENHKSLEGSATVAEVQGRKPSSLLSSAEKLQTSFHSLSRWKGHNYIRNEGTSLHPLPVSFKVVSLGIFKIIYITSTR